MAALTLRTIVGTTRADIIFCVRLWHIVCNNRNSSILWRRHAAIHQRCAFCVNVASNAIETTEIKHMLIQMNSLDALDHGQSEEIGPMKIECEFVEIDGLLWQMSRFPHKTAKSASMPLRFVDSRSNCLVFCMRLADSSMHLRKWIVNLCSKYLVCSSRFSRNAHTAQCCKHQS